MLLNRASDGSRSVPSGWALWCVLVVACWCGASGGVEVEDELNGIGTGVDAVLRQLREAGLAIRTYQAQVEYMFRQPLFESQTLRKGILYYARFGPKSKLRIKFESLKQDDEREQKYLEEYIFDGVWLIHLDYQLREVKRYQQAEPNEPVDAFDLVGRNFPMVGFTRVEDLRRDFEVGLLAEPREPGLVGLSLAAKEGSAYRDEYSSILFWVDKRTGLPGRIVANSVEQDVYEIILVAAKVNKGLKAGLFEFAIPAGFTEAEVVPLEVGEQGKR